MKMTNPLLKNQQMQPQFERKMRTTQIQSKRMRTKQSIDMTRTMKMMMMYKQTKRFQLGIDSFINNGFIVSCFVNMKHVEVS